MCIRDRFYTSTFEEFLENANRLGFFGVQLIPDQMPNLYDQFDEARIASLLHQMQKYSLKPSIHNVFYDLNLTSLIPDVQRNSIKITKRVIDLCVSLNAELITIHPGYIYPGWLSDSKQNQNYWNAANTGLNVCLLYTSPSPRDATLSRMPSSA